MLLKNFTRKFGVRACAVTKSLYKQIKKRNKTKTNNQVSIKKKLKNITQINKN